MRKALVALAASLIALTLVLFPLVANTAPLFSATASSGESVTLHTVAGPCVGEAKLAVYRDVSARNPVEGCYVFGSVDGVEHVLISYLDGARGTIPRGHFRRVEAI